MGILSALGNLFTGGKSSNETDSRIAIKGDISPIPQNLITPDYRPASGGIYVTTSADLVRQWDSKKWMITEEDLEQLMSMHTTLKNYEELCKKYGKELVDFAKTEARLVQHITKTIPKIAGANYAQYAANQKMNGDMDAIGAEYQKNIALRQAQAQQLKQNLANKLSSIQQRTKTLRGG